MKKVEYLIKHNRFIQLIYRFSFSFLFSLISFFIPVNRNLVLISSFSGKKFNDSPKAIFDYMVKSGLIERYEVVWAFENASNFESYHLNTVKIDSFKYFMTAFKAKYWITNVNIERGLKFKKRNQIYLNTWHGTGPKTCGNAASGRKDYNFKNVDYICSDGEYLKEILVRDLKANPKNVFLCGRPREDSLYHPNAETIKALRTKYEISDGDFVILYAPTWREARNNSTKSSFDLTLDIKQILESIPNSKILFRAHSITDSINTDLTFNKRFISATDEPEINDLFLVSNVLITDFSSAITDFSILKKPFICFAPDFDDYIRERALYYDINKEFPFGVQKSSSEVISILNDIISGNNKLDAFASFKQKYAPYGGGATLACIDYLFGGKKAH